ncbi:hypothetical protein [Rhodoplanes sp. Z2-YC6860]|uniref:hypothetical protein n=1 Tax=Rhodoplanes sp. Z2-YC6860 TaxID=674703 RepID=UPI0012EDE6F8|nr:hypothetical protein [Rhodoplanes sp. Z2-YC6860]
MPIQKILSLPIGTPYFPFAYLNGGDKSKENMSCVHRGKSPDLLPYRLEPAPLQRRPQTLARGAIMAGAAVLVPPLLVALRSARSRLLHTIMAAALATTTEVALTMPQPVGAAIVLCSGVSAIRHGGRESIAFESATSINEKQPGTSINEKQPGRVRSVSFVRRGATKKDQERRGSVTGYFGRKGSQWLSSVQRGAGRVSNIARLPLRERHVRYPTAVLSRWFLRQRGNAFNAHKQIWKLNHENAASLSSSSGAQSDHTSKDQGD